MKQVKRKGRQITALFLSIVMIMFSLIPGEVVKAEVVSTSTYAPDGYITEIGLGHKSGPAIPGNTEVYLYFRYKGSMYTVATINGVPFGNNSLSGSYTLTGKRIGGVDNPTISISGSETGITPSYTYTQSVSGTVQGDTSYSKTQSASGSLAGVKINCNIPVEKIVASTMNVPPTITAPDYEDVLGGPAPQYSYMEDVIGRYGKTTSKTFGNGNNTHGTIAWITGTTALTSGMINFDKIGVESHDYLATDTSDGTTATGSRLVISKLGYNLKLDAEYASGSDAGSAYDVMDPVLEDGWTREDVKVITQIPYFNGLAVQGDYILNLQSGALQDGGSLDSYSHMITSDFNGTSAATLTAAAPYTHIDLASPEALSVKVDKTDPIADAAATVSGDVVTITDTSSDALSGLSALNPTQYALVPKGTTPVNGDYAAGSTITAAGIGVYELWVWAKDKAGNQDRAKSTAGDIVILSTVGPTVTGKYGAGAVDEAGLDISGQSIASGTWTNQDVDVVVELPSGSTGDVWTALYQNGIQSNKAGSALTELVVNFTSEEPAADQTKTGYMVAGDDTILSPPENYVVLIDKTIPAGDLSYNAGSPDYGFTDISTDTGSSVGANSGVDAAKTIVAMVPYGSSQPVSSDYVSIAGAEIPDDGKYYDVWVIATDNAGNKSIPVKALTHISYSLDDEIRAKNFAYDIAAGSASLTDDMAKMLSHVKAIYQGGGTVPLANIDADATELQDIRDAIDAGLAGTTWPLTFSTQGGTSGSVTIQVTLYDHGSAPDPAPGPLTHELIYGNNFTYGMNNGDITDDAAKLYANTAAFESNGTVIPSADITVDATELQDINDAIAAKDKSGNSFPLTFYTPDGTSVTVNVTLKDHGNEPVNPGDDIITANDFDYGLDEPAILDNVAKLLAQVDAKDGNGAAINLSAITVDTAELQTINDAIAAQDKSGSPFPLTFSTPSGAEVTVNVTLKDHGAGDPVNGTDHIAGNDFFYGLNQPSIIDDLAKLYANVTAVEEDGTPMRLWRRAKKRPSTTLS